MGTEWHNNSHGRVQFQAATFLAEDLVEDCIAISGQGYVLRKKDLAALTKDVAFSCGDRSIVVTSSAGHGMYWAWRGSELLLSTTEKDIVLALGRDSGGYDNLSIARYLHDDVNLSPLATLFENVRQIPGGCVAFFTRPGEPPNLFTFLAEPVSQGRRRFNPEELQHSIQSVAAKVGEKSNGLPIYLLLSGGIDGSLWLCALAKQGARLVVVYGDDGELQNQINQLLIQKLRENFPASKISYHHVTGRDFDPQALRDYQLSRLNWHVKGNYLKRNYKLALADYFISRESKPFSFAVNGYGTDEIYMGGKASARASSIYRPSFRKTADTIRNIGIFSRFSLTIFWLKWQVGRVLGWPDRVQAFRLGVRLASGGKTGGKLGDRADESAGIFQRALRRDVGDVVDMLLSSIPTIDSRDKLSLFDKLFSYYFVEQSHMIRFHNHGQALGMPYLLPFSFQEIRQSPMGYHPGIREMWRPKHFLHVYLRKVCGVDYDTILQEADEAKRTPVAERNNQSRRQAKRAPKIFRHLKKKFFRAGDDIPSEKSDYFRWVAESLSTVETDPEVQQDLEELADGDYVATISDQLRAGDSSIRYSSKEVYNYCHLLIYLSGIRAVANH